MSEDVKKDIEAMDENVRKDIEAVDFSACDKLLKELRDFMVSHDPSFFEQITTLFNYTAFIAKIYFKTDSEVKQEATIAMMTEGLEKALINIFESEGEKK